MNFRYCAFALLVTIGLSGVSHADAAQAAAYLETLHTDLGHPGVSGAIAVDGEIVWSGGAGYADVESGRAATPDTVYRLGSVSKVVTAAAVALLVQEGKLDLDAPVQRYVPEFPEKDQGAITTRLLAGHLSGLPHYQGGDTPDTRRPDYDSVIASLAEFRDKPQLSAPGTEFRYSTYGWTLVSAVVERAAGVPFPDFLKQRVFDPLGMPDTRVERWGETVPRVATFYVPYSGGTTRVAPEMHVSYKWAGGGMLSTVTDLARFGSAWLPGSTFFKPETLELVLTGQTLSDGTPIETGIGWRIGTDSEGRTICHHGGAIAGGRAFILVRPGDRVVVAILANLLARKTFAQGEAGALADAFLE